MSIAQASKVRGYRELTVRQLIARGWLPRNPTAGDCQKLQATLRQPVRSPATVLTR